ncbi:MAG: inositol monophosphatase [Desulfobacteraceae bacterium]|nr:MAG: inositol monophosphatase [Desulfobacteraceae bacterium]
MDLEPIKRTGVLAAYRAGRILNEHFGNSIRVTKKGAIDLVTEADLASEKVIVDTIKEVFPDHAFLAEESGGIQGNSLHRWIIDPLDGTTNFAHHLPIFAVSIAYAHADKMMMGIVFNPINGELFSALRSEGARLNDHPIRVSNTRQLSDSLLVTGFPYTVRSTPPTLLIEQFTRCLTSSQGVRRLGSAALDLCYVGCGRFDGFWEENLKPWDTAAGMLIAMEAGAKVTDYGDRPYDIYGKQILATNAYIHREMVDLLNTEVLK